MINMKDPQYINKDEYVEDMRVNDQMYFVAIKFPAKFQVMYNDDTEFLAISMTKGKWHAIANMVMHDIEGGNKE